MIIYKASFPEIYAASGGMGGMQAHGFRKIFLAHNGAGGDERTASALPNKFQNLGRNQAICFASYRCFRCRRWTKESFSARLAAFARQRRDYPEIARVFLRGKDALLARIVMIVPAR